MQLLTRSEAAKMLGVTKSTLNQWSTKKIGPPMVKLSGKLVMYDEAELIAWVDSHRCSGREGI